MDQAPYNNDFDSEDGRRSYTAIIIIGSLITLIIVSAFLTFYFLGPKFGNVRTVSPFNEISEGESASFNEEVGKINYIIPGVPAVNIYSNVISNTPIRTIPAVSLYSVFKYWGSTDEEIDVNRLAAQFAQENRSYSLSDFGAYAFSIGYSVRIEKLSSYEEFAKYINEDIRTPLIFSIARSEKVSPLVHRVLIGVLESESKFVMHGYYQGNNYEMIREDFDKFIATDGFGNKRTESNQYRFLVIQPKNLDAVLASMPKPKPYPERTRVMESSIPDILNRAGGALGISDSNRRAAVLKDVLNEPDFESLMAKHWQVFYWSRYAEALLEQGFYTSARPALTRALELNQNLNVSEDGWPAYHAKELHEPWRVLAKYYSALASREANPSEKARLELLAENARDKDAELLSAQHQN